MPNCSTPLLPSAFPKILFSLKDKTMEELGSMWVYESEVGLSFLASFLVLTHTSLEVIFLSRFLF